MKKVELVEREVEDLDQWIVPGSKKEERDLYVDRQLLRCYIMFYWNVEIDLTRFAVITAPDRFRIA